MTTLRNDLRYAARLLIKSPAFTVVAVATLAIGIGANAAIFSVVDAALLNPLPYPTPDRLVAVWETLQRDTVERREFSYPDYRDLRDRTMSFDAIAAWAPETLTMSTPEAPARQVSGDLASAAYFELLGVTPIAGRIYTKTEDAERDAHPVSLVSYAFWQRELGGVPAVGRGIVLNDRAFTIIGVLPKGFRGLNDNSDVWIPMGMLGVAESSYEQRGARWHQVVARLKDGVSLQQANADVTSIARQLGQAYPSKVSYGAAVFSLQQEIVGRVEPLLLTLLAAVGLVPLLPCVNLANLLPARATTRRRATALRAAPGPHTPRVLPPLPAGSSPPQRRRRRGRATAGALGRGRHHRARARGIPQLRHPPPGRGRPALRDRRLVWRGHRPRAVASGARLTGGSQRRPQGGRPRIVGRRRARPDALGAGGDASRAFPAAPGGRRLDGAHFHQCPKGRSRLPARTRPDYESSVAAEVLGPAAAGRCRAAGADQRGLRRAAGRDWHRRAVHGRCEPHLFHA